MEERLLVRAAATVKMRYCANVTNATDGALASIAKAAVQRKNVDVLFERGLPKSPDTNVVCHETRRRGYSKATRDGLLAGGEANKSQCSTS